MDGKTEVIAEDLRQIIATGDHEQIVALVDTAHSADLAEWLEDFSQDEARTFLAAIDDDRLADIFDYLDDHAQAELGGILPPNRLTSIVEKMAPDEAADLLGALDSPTSQRILQAMEAEEAGEVRNLLQYPPDTAGGLMTLDLVAIRSSLTVRDAIAELRRQAPSDTETVYYAYVTDDDNHLVGVLSLRGLLASGDDQRVGDVMMENVVSVSVDTDQGEVAHLMERYGFLAMPVVDDTGRLVGIVTIDDAMSAAEEETTEDIFRQQGLSISDTEMLRSERIIKAPLRSILRLRLPWLLVVLVGGLLAGGVIGRFESMLETVVVLAFFIPVIMDMGGNVGTQASTIFVRGIILGHIEMDKLTPYIVREATTGLVIGTLTGFGAGVIASIWQADVRIGLVVFITMALTCTLASFVGFVIPALMHRFGFDPAAASNPLITTIKDVTGLVLYFTIASMLLGHLF